MPSLTIIKSSLPRLWMTLPVLYYFSLVFELSSFNGFYGLLWGRAGYGFTETVLISAAFIISAVLLWTKWMLPGSLLLFVTFLTFKNIQPHLFTGWAFVFAPLLIFRAVSINRKSDISYCIFFFYLMSIYFIPSLDRLTFRDWFDGRIISVLLSSPFFARWPVTIPSDIQIFLSPLSVLSYLIEALVPFLYLWGKIDRRKLAIVMIAFHSLLWVLTEIQIWHPLMILIWLDLYFNTPDFSFRNKVSIVIGLIMISPFSYIFGKEIVQKVTTNIVSTSLQKAGLQSFGGMRMFTFKIPIFESASMTYQHGDQTLKVERNVMEYLARSFFFVGAPKKQDTSIDILCRYKKDGPLKINFEARWNKTKHFQKTKVSDCSI